METKFKIGQELFIKTEPGYTGTVIMIMGKYYLLDCHPGALGWYKWIWLRDENGLPHLYAANWFYEDELTVEG